MWRGWKRSGALALLLFFAVLLMPGTARAAGKPESLVPLGVIAGIEVETEGVLVTDYTGPDSPAKAAGIKPGDVIVALGSYHVNSGSDLRFACAHLGPEKICLTLRRSGVEQQLTVAPAKREEGYELGVVVRDGLSGIGTMTFYDPATGIFGALGHGITEGEGGWEIPLRAGNITRSVITGVIKGLHGTPGRILGMADGGKVRGSVDINSPYGIFGLVSFREAVEQGEPLPVAAVSEIRRGSATLLSNIDGEGVREYSVEIVKVYEDGREGRDMYVRITDDKLIAITGGIVQGMSGSPILQDGKLIGALTHVLVKDPTRGYAITMDHMLDAAYDL